MLKNNLKIAIRSILKHKFFSAINILGLVIGMTCCLFIFVYILDEISYDKFHYDHENLYRVALHGRISGQEIHTTTSSLPLAPTMKEEIPGIEAAVRLIPMYGGSMRYEDKSFVEDKIFYADSNFYDFFSFTLKKGDPKTALKEPNSIVVTEATAKKYFGDEDPIGKILIVGNNKLACKVTGITEEAPSNSHIHFNGLISFETVQKTFYGGWTGNSFQTYIRKNPATRVDDINQKLEDIVEKYVGDEIKKGLGVDFQEFRKQGGIYSYYIYPIAESHLYPKAGDDIEPSNDIRYVYIFAGVGIFILLIACINFMNLSTAQSAGRAKEVGLRKTLGSLRTQMIWQFLSESFIYGLVAVILAVAASFLILPYFNLLAGKQLTLAALMNPAVLLAIFALIVVVGFVAGSYPAFYLTSFNVVEVLKGKVRTGGKSKGVRSSLVVIQFAVSTFLIIATVVVYQQLSYMQNKNLGLDKNGVINVTGIKRLGTNQQAFKTAVEAQGGIVKTSFADNTFPGINNTTVIRKKGSDADHLVGLIYTDWDQVDVMKMELTQGRFFSREFKSDTVACVINEAAIKEFGLSDPLAGELITFDSETPKVAKIIGVLKNFNFETLKAEVRPLVIKLTETGRALAIRYEGNPQNAVAAIEQQWKALAPGEAFDYTFLDQDFDSLFRTEMRLRDIFTVFSTLAIFIACLGLFALAAFTTEQRTKEIGVRKALGASVFSLTLLLSKEFTRLVLIAIVPAIAGGRFVASWWLNDFSYRIELNPMLFLGSGLAAIVIA
ncbi:MAG TPA: ABC transporter permease, partial [Cyclobacteriaceae bacterium]|nr:ABC transporter permease [Cyclobacteriaceae bacterium]